MFEFLLDNWFLTLVALWFLMSLFGQGNEQKEKRKSRPSPVREMPNPQPRRQTQSPNQAKEWATELRKRIEDAERAWSEQLETVPASDLDEVLSPRPNLRKDEKLPTREDRSPEARQDETLIPYDGEEGPYAQEKEDPYARKDEDPYARKDENPYALEDERTYIRDSERPYAQHVKRTVLSTHRTALKQGIIWAEVLGKPRAKRPYRPPYLR